MMAGLWHRCAETPEGKYPIVLRRDGTPMKSRYFVLVLKDPAAEEALRAYAAAAKAFGMDPQYVDDLNQLANEAHQERINSLASPAPEHRSDPDAPPHRPDDQAILAWARSIGCPGS